MSAAQVRVLIPAAGRGTRYGGAVLKQYLPIGGEAVLAHTIRSFQYHPSISGITVVVTATDRWFESALGALAATVETVTGGATRARSVRNGLQFIAAHHPQTEWVLVHDAARPCLPPACLDRLIEQGLQTTAGAILAVPVGDTLKRAGDSQEITATVDRQGLWWAQTPQLFPLARLIEAIDAAQAAGQALTDEAAAMEFVGSKPKLVMGSAANIKITYPDDLLVAAALLGHSETSARE